MKYCRYVFTRIKLLTLLCSCFLTEEGVGFKAQEAQVMTGLTRILPQSQGQGTVAVFAGAACKLGRGLQRRF